MNNLQPPSTASTGFAPAPEPSARKRIPLDMGSLVPENTAAADDPERPCTTCAAKAWFEMSSDARHRKAIAVLLDIAGDQERIRPFSVEWEALVHARAELVNLVAKSGVPQ